VSSIQTPCFQRPTGQFLLGQNRAIWAVREQFSSLVGGVVQDSTKIRQGNFKLTLNWIWKNITEQIVPDGPMGCSPNNPWVPFNAGLFFTESNVFTTPPPENRRAEGWSPAPTVETQQKLLGWALSFFITVTPAIFRGEGGQSEASCTRGRVLTKHDR